MAKKGFNIRTQALPTAEQAYSVLLGDKTENQIVELPIDLIDEIKDQPFKIHQDKIEQIVESMRAVGQLEPVTVVPSQSEEGRYTLLAGRHRKRATEALGKTTIRAIIKQEKDIDKQRLILLATNNDRNNDYAPSERAFSYLEQQEIYKKLGYSKNVSAVAEENDTNRKTVHKYIQLTKLDKALLHRVDKGEITVGAGYELSFIPKEKQKKISMFLFNNSGKIHINKSKARALRDNPDRALEILSDVPKQEAPQSREKNKSFSKSEVGVKSSSDVSQEEIPYEIQMSIAKVLYENFRSIFKNIVVSFFTPEDTEKYIYEKYCKSKYGVIIHKSCIINYDRNSVSVVLFNNKEKTYKLKLKKIDSICREYLKKSVSKDELISMIMVN